MEGGQRSSRLRTRTTTDDERVEQSLLTNCRRHDDLHSQQQAALQSAPFILALRLCVTACALPIVLCTATELRTEIPDGAEWWLCAVQMAQFCCA